MTIRRWRGNANHNERKRDAYFVAYFWWLESNSHSFLTMILKLNRMFSCLHFQLLKITFRNDVGGAEWLNTVTIATNQVGVMLLNYIYFFNFYFLMLMFCYQNHASVSHHGYSFYLLMDFFWLVNLDVLNPVTMTKNFYRWQHLSPLHCPNWDNFFMDINLTRH